MSVFCNQSGLNDQEVQKRISEFGFNELPSAKPKNFINIFIEVLKEPMFILLVLCCIFYSLIGDSKQALLLSVFVLVIIGITFFQSWKTEKTLEALKNLSSPKATVIRNGQELLISSCKIVPDDIMVIEEGDKISADAIVLESLNLMVEESLLTGESLPINKSNYTGEKIENIQGSTVDHYVYSGTLVTQGKAYTKVIATGAHTKLGKIGTSLKSIHKEDSRFKKESSLIVARILTITVFLCIVIIAIFYFTRGELAKGLLTSITFAIAMLPEEIPAVLTIFMALGAWRISQKNVLTKKMPAIETLGSVTVLCTDKTGTITENKMIINRLYAKGQAHKITGTDSIPESFHDLLESAILASKEDSFDPIEKAISQITSSKLIESKHIHTDWKFIQEYPLSKELFAMSRAWDLPDSNKEFLLYSKGAPEAIFELCHFNKEETRLLTAEVEQMASIGLRVLGVAKSKSKLQSLPLIQHDIDFEFCGLIGFSDPVRPEVKAAVQDCYNAGIKVIMITGDYHVTAQNIAKEIGLKNINNYLTGSELDKLSDEELQAKILDVGIFSRVIPEQKLRIIKALKANNQIIAMTGDGVNDAPALKASHVGIAMGRKGTDVARESADLILLDDNFASIVFAIRLGRRVFDNLTKAMSYILAIHIPIAGLTLIPVIFNGLPVIFFPIHVAFMELIIDPTCSVIFEAEPEHPETMHKVPKKITDSILSYKNISSSILQGLVVLTITGLVYFTAINNNYAANDVRSLSFGALLLSNLGLTAINKSWNYRSFKDFSTGNKAFLVIVFAVISIFCLILTIPSLKQLFYF